MGGMRTVTTPDGATWRIKRHWISRTPKLRDREGPGGEELFDLFSVFNDTPLALIVVVVLLVAFFFFNGFFLFLAEVVIVTMVLVVTLVAKVFLRRPWFVDAVCATKAPRRWAVVGWRRSGEVIEQLAKALEAGVGFNSPHAREVAPPLRALEDWKEKSRPEGRL